MTAFVDINGHFCVTALSYLTISLVVVCDKETEKEKKCFFSVQVLFIIPIEQSE